MRSIHLLACTGLLSCALLLPCASAVALDDTAFDHAQRARIAYDLRDWTTAIDAYRSAYAAEPKADHLFGLAQALRQSGDYAAAIYTFKAYRRLQGVTPRQASAADLLIAKCEAEQAAKAEASPIAARQEVAPVPPAVEASANTAGEPTAPRSERLGAASPLEPLPTQTAMDRPTVFYADVLGDALFIAGLAGAGVGAGLLIGGNSAMNDVAEEPTDGRASAAADSARERQVAGAVLLPLGGALIAGALWRWVSVGREAPDEAGGLAIGPRYIEYSGRF